MLHRERPGASWQLSLVLGSNRQDAETSWLLQPPAAGEFIQSSCLQFSHSFAHGPRCIPRGWASNWELIKMLSQKIRLSWNKHNVYNLARSVGRDRSTADRMTFFQMKWDAKARTRGYHGDHITEKKWKRMFSHRLMSAVDLPPEYLAANDGSEQAAGRGSGKSTNTVTAETFSKVPGLSAFSRPTHGSQMPRKNFGDPEGMLSQHHKNMTPYMQMAYAPLERRLDMAVFRALFASSIRQARQFVIHGAVMVNGKKVRRLPRHSIYSVLTDFRWCTLPTCSTPATCSRSIRRR